MTKSNPFDMSNPFGLRSDDPLARFRVSRLTAEPLPGGSEGAYQLTPFSVNPTRVIGRDKRGFPIEDTIPICYWRPMVHPHGHVNKVPMRTGPTLMHSVEGERYEQQQLRELIASGWMPLEVCPYTAEFRAITRTPYLVDNPDKIDDCGGRPDGCEHMRAVIEARLKWSREIHDELQRQQMSEGDAIAMIQRFTAAQEMVANMASVKPPAPSSRPPRPGDRLKDNDGEP